MTFQEIARLLDPLDPKTELRELLDQHYSDPPLTSLAQVESRHSHRGRVSQRFFAFNTFLMDLLGDGKKPAVNHRDEEIGRYTAAKFDLVCLSEVWHREERQDLLGCWNPKPNMAHRSGRRALSNAVAMLGSSGLVSISRDFEILADHFHEFKNESGEDKFARKGCLLTVLDPGFEQQAVPSSLNVYSIHLNASGRAKILQVLELAKFVWQTKDRVSGSRERPGRSGLNGCIIAGDFNIARGSTAEFVETNELAESREGQALPEHIRNAINHHVDGTGTATGVPVARKSSYSLLRDILASLGFVDLWTRRNNEMGYTSDLTKPGVGDLIARPTTDQRYCRDEVNPVEARALDAPPEAIDFIFISPTTEQMSFTMDFTRPRRPYTIRPSGAKDLAKIKFMSDHLGLSTTLLLAPKH